MFKRLASGFASFHRFTVSMLGAVCEAHASVMREAAKLPGREYPMFIARMHYRR
jgi:hypothetical protein